MKIELKKRQTRILLLILLGIVVNLSGELLTGREYDRLMRYNDVLLNTMRVRDKVKDLRSDALLIESRIRGFVITEKPEFAKNIDAEFERAFANLKTIRDKMSTEPGFIKFVDSLNHLIEQKIRFQRQILELYKRHGKSQAEKLIASGTGKALRENIISVTAILEEFTNSEIARIEADVQAQERTATMMDNFFPYTSTLIFFVLGFLLMRNIGKHQNLLEKSGKAIEKEKAAYMVKDQFISNISHEVRTPLNSVIGYSGLLQKTNLNETQQKFARAIQTSGENLLYIINELLDLGKIEEGLMVMKKERFSVPELVDQVALMFQEGFKKKDVEFCVVVDPALKNVLGDAVKMRQVLVNLINNALKFTENGSVEVQVRQTHIFNNRTRVQIVIKDTGIGISREHLPRIFERFYQVESAIDRRYGGTGLGLAIIHQLIGLMGGTISVASELNKGTEFTIDIPFDLPGQVEPETYSITIKVPQEKKKRILVVDDNMLNRELTMHVLSSWNYEVLTVESGMKALDKLAFEKYDLILMDVQMPGMDGYTVTRKIRKELDLQIPVIALTAHSTKTEREKCLQAGMNDYVSKPFNELELFGVITRLLVEPVTNTINLDYLRSLSKGNEDFERKILKRFVQEIPAQIAGLQTALYDKDTISVRKIIHDMKANAAIVGMEQKLEEDFVRLTNFGSGTEMEKVLESFEAIRKNLDKSIDEINQRSL